MFVVWPACNRGLGSARGSRAGWKARPLLHPRYGGVSPKQALAFYFYPQMPFIPIRTDSEELN
jgi:hypothetical protein